MRVEDKELEGPEVEREQRLEEEENLEQGGELPDLAGVSLVSVEHEHRTQLLDALHAIMAGDTINVTRLLLPKRESAALEMLQTAVTGRSPHMNEFVYAEDRSTLLEQALAVLQENLTGGNSTELLELHAQFESLTEGVAVLRDQLVSLENAQDDMIEEARWAAEFAKGEAPDTTDKPKPKPTDDPGPTLLDKDPRGPLPEREEHETTLVGGKDLPAKKVASTLDGEPVVVPAWASTLGDAKP